MSLYPEKAIDCVMSEYEFLVSLIRMYREFQMQAVGFSILLYTAVLGLLGSALQSKKLTVVAGLTTALLPYLVFIVVLAFTVMEVRIRRASLYITSTLTPRLQALLGAPQGAVILEFESAPSRHLSWSLKRFAPSTAFILLIGLPGLAAALLPIVFRVIPNIAAHPGIAWAGAILLAIACIIAATISAMAESRDNKSASPAGEATRSWKEKLWLPLFFGIAACSWMPHWACHYYWIETHSSFTAGRWVFSRSESLVALVASSGLVLMNLLGVVWARPRAWFAVITGVGHLAIGAAHTAGPIWPSGFDVFNHLWPVVTSTQGVVAVIAFGGLSCVVAAILRRDAQ